MKSLRGSVIRLSDVRIYEVLLYYITYLLTYVLIYMCTYIPYIIHTFIHTCLYMDLHTLCVCVCVCVCVQVGTYALLQRCSSRLFCENWHWSSWRQDGVPGKSLPLGLVEVQQLCDDSLTYCIASFDIGAHYYLKLSHTHLIGFLFAGESYVLVKKKSNILIL